MQPQKLRPACRLVAELIQKHLEELWLRTDETWLSPDDPLAKGLIELAAEMRKRAEEPGSETLTRKQQIRELRRADPDNPLYWTEKQKRRAERKAKV